MAINKVDFGGRNLIDLTADTVSPGTLFEGETAHNKGGSTITGGFTIVEELAQQGAKIAAIENALKGKGAAACNVQPLTITKNGNYTASGGVDGYSPIIVQVPSSGGKWKSGKVTYGFDTVFTTDSPITINHGLGVVPNYFSFTCRGMPKSGNQANYFFNVSAMTNGGNLCIKGSYYGGNYPELYIFEPAGSLASNSPHPSSKSAVDVWGATTQSIKMGAIRAGVSTIPGGYEYTWVVGVE